MSELTTKGPADLRHGIRGTAAARLRSHLQETPPVPPSDRRPLNHVNSSANFPDEAKFWEVFYR
jgi:hypothetical protein